MLNLPLVGPGGHPIVFDRTRIVAVREITPAENNDARCLVYLGSQGTGLEVKGSIEEIKQQINEGSATTPDEMELQPAKEVQIGDVVQITASPEVNRFSGCLAVVDIVAADEIRFQVPRPGDFTVIGVIDRRYVLRVGQSPLGLVGGQAWSLSADREKDHE